MIKEKKHALLAPSSASRWLTCTPSARLEEKIVEEKPSTYADEGTVAHALAELLIEQKLYRVTQAEYDEIFLFISNIPNEDDGTYYNEEMHEHCENFAEFVIEKYKDALN